MKVNCSNIPLNENINITLHHINEIAIDDLAQMWLDLEHRASPQFFLSWKWLGCWLRQINAKFPIFLLSAKHNDKTIALALFVERKIRRHGVINSRQWYLHRSGDNKLDQIWIENNNFLLDEQYADALYPMLWHWLLTHQTQVDEFIVDVAKVQQHPILKQENINYRRQLENLSVGYTVQLSNLTCGQEYLGQLSKNTRQQIKRSLNKLQQLGNIAFNVTPQTTEQLNLLSKTKHWHIEKWQHTKTPSGFTNEAFSDFHTQLVKNKHPNAHTLVASLKLNNEVLGCLYCFSQQSTVYFYLSTLKPFNNNQIKLGLTLHYLLIDWLISNGTDCNCYDFLAGDARYKQSLSTSTDHYGKLTMQRQSFKFRLERSLARLKHRIQHAFVTMNKFLFTP